MKPHFATQVVETMLDEAFAAHHGLPPSKEFLELFAPFAQLRRRAFDKCRRDRRLTDFPRLLANLL